MNPNYLLQPFIVLTLMIGCQKAPSPYEQTKRQDVPEEETSITIQGELDDFEPNTKAGAQIVSRIIWSGGERVYVYKSEKEIDWDDEGDSFYYDKVSYIGALTATVVDGTEGRVAKLSGTITSAPKNGKLFLLHSPILDNPPTSSIQISLATQSPYKVSFVAYAVVDFDKQQINDLKAKFTFATSVLFANISGLRTDGRYVWGAQIVGINTCCYLNFHSDGTVYVGGSGDGTISVVDYMPDQGNVPNDKGNLGVYFAVPVSSKNTSRYIKITQDAPPGGNGYLIGGKFATAALQSGKTYLTQQHCSTGEYTEGSYNGQGVFIPKTGIWWAPVNCGYSESTPKGMLYQWGRRFPISASTTPTYITTVASNIAAGNDESTRGKFYKGNSCWYSLPSASDLWEQAYDPCPSGWRVPKTDEFGELFYYSWDRTKRTGTLRGSYTTNGWDFSSLGYNFILSNPGSYRSYTGSTNSGGSYWTSSTSGSLSDAIYFHSQSKKNENSVSLIDKNARAYGYYVRCVAD